MSNNSEVPMDGGHAKAVVPLVYNGMLIHERHEMLSLTDMWKASGSLEGRRPDDWKKDSANRAFLDHVALVANAPVEGIWKGRRGAGGGTWAHWHVAMAYAKYLDHNFHMWCNDVVRRHMEGAPPQLPVGLTSDDRAAIGGIIKGIVNKAVAELLPALVREQVSSGHHAVISGISAGEVLEMAGVEKGKRLRGLAQWVSTRLRDFHSAKGVLVRIARLGSRKTHVFDELVCRQWLAAGGKAEIEQKVAERCGQCVLRLVLPTNPKGETA